MDKMRATVDLVYMMVRWEHRGTQPGNVFEHVLPSVMAVMAIDEDAAWTDTHTYDAMAPLESIVYIARLCIYRDCATMVRGNDVADTVEQLVATEMGHIF
jgi:hypothetical protein